jgi:hypothetical protein
MRCRIYEGCNESLLVRDRQESTLELPSGMIRGSSNRWTGSLPGRSGDVTAGDRKGSAVKTLWVCVLFSLLSIVAYSGFSGVLNGAGQPLPEGPASPSIAATPPSLNTPVGPIALDASSGRPAPGSTGNDSDLAAGLSEYLFLHKTWNESLSAPAGTELSVPWHWLRIYAVTHWPTESR